MKLLSTVKGRSVAALTVGLVLCILIVTPFVMSIKYFDWGVGLILVAPVLVWVLMRMARALEAWALNESSTHMPDPDYPDEPR